MIKYFSKLQQRYLERYPDVKKAGVGAFTHYAIFGLREGRRMFSRLDQPTTVNKLIRFFELGKSLLDQYYSSRYLGGRRSNALAHWLFIGVWKKYKLLPPFTPSIEGTMVGLRFQVAEPTSGASGKSPLPKFLHDEILHLASLEPALLAPGIQAIPNLNIVMGSSLQAKTGLDVLSIDRQVLFAPKTVVVVPHIVLGGADAYVSRLIERLINAGKGPVLTLLTLPHATFEQSSILGKLYKGFSASQVVFWRDIETHAQADPRSLAVFLNALLPENLIIVNSDLALRMMTKYGRGISSKMRVFIGYFSLDVSAFAAQYGIRFARQISKFSRTFTDNARAAETLNRLYLGDHELSATVLPSAVDTLNIDDFNRRVVDRGRRVPIAARKREWLWISRLDKFKGTHLLGELARLRPEDNFTVFGAQQAESLRDLGLDLPNIKYRGVLPSISAADFSKFDGFLFTSEFEGLPIILLEMTQHAVPIVTTTVGDIDNTFRNASIFKVESRLTQTQKATAFLEAMEMIACKTEIESVEMVSSAYQDVLERHSEPVAAAKFLEFIEDVTT